MSKSCLALSTETVGLEMSPVMMMMTMMMTTMMMIMMMMIYFGNVSITF